MQTQQRTDSRQPTSIGDRAGALACRAREARTLLAAAWRAHSGPRRGVAVVAAVAAIAVVPLVGIPLASALTTAALLPAILVDLHVRRLPDTLVAGAAVVGGAALVVDVASGAHVAGGGVALGAVAMAGPMFVLHVVSPGSMGFGDVKLGIVLGAALGAVHWQLALSGLALAAGLSAVVALLRRRDTIAFGPGLWVGALLAFAANPMLVPEDPAVEPLNTGGRPGFPLAPVEDGTVVDGPIVDGLVIDGAVVA
jgi:leader peptidase (prepilin peptidase)/N-methyltransferase